MTNYVMYIGNATLTTTLSLTEECASVTGIKFSVLVGHHEVM